MISAIIVMAGHILRFTTKDYFELNIFFISFFQIGSFSVLLFFGLSGLALRYQTDKFGINRTWLIGRMIRLLPMYWLTFALPILLFTYIYKKELNYPSYGYFLTFFGMNSYVSEIRIPPVNNPLWSLAVEINLSIFLIILGKIKRNTYQIYCILLLIIVSAIYGKNQPIAIAIPVFYLGYILPSFNIKPIKFALTKKIITVLFIIFFIFISNIILKSDISTYRGKFLQYILVFLLLLYCLVIPELRKRAPQSTLNALMPYMPVTFRWC